MIFGVGVQGRFWVEVQDKGNECIVNITRCQMKFQIFMLEATAFLSR